MRPRLHPCLPLSTPLQYGYWKWEGDGACEMHVQAFLFTPLDKLFVCDPFSHFLPSLDFPFRFCLFPLWLRFAFLVTPSSAYSTILPETGIK